MTASCCPARWIGWCPGLRARSPWSAWCAKIWLDELAIQTGTKREKELAKARKLVAEHNRKRAEVEPMLPGCEL